ncbi:uncharacterized protein LOC116853705, partial [Odontomachus brunneus]|uniref:uncharacterized protein LOC116853705 n=1 Tax=Odontomachus brunneus TaxID=486640 RepID=UPI0013F1F714
PPPQDEIRRLVAYAEERELELFLGCDANSHHVGWGSTNINQREESLHNFVMGTGLIILNRGTTPTFRDSRREEVIDITIGYRKDLMAMLTNAPTRFHTYDYLDMTARHLEDSIRNAFEANCPVTRKHSTTKIPWWNKELQKLRSEVRRKFNKAKKTGLPLGNIQKFPIIENASETSRLSRILSQDNRPILGCLKRPDGNYTESMRESLKHLLETHFPGFQETTYSQNKSDDQKTREEYKPREWSLAAEVVSPKAVEWAVRTFDPYKAQGPDGISPILLQKGLSYLLGPLNENVQGYLERLVDNHLKRGPLTLHPLTSSQYAYREGRSIDTALHHPVSRIETQLEAKGYTLGVFLDIEGAFDSTSYKMIREAMTRHYIPTALVDWTQSMLTERSITVNFGDLTLEDKLSKGCPQGSVLSLLLWSLVVNDLLVKLQEMGLSTYGYADDAVIVARGNFFSTLKELDRYSHQGRTKLVSGAKKPLRLWDIEIKYVPQVKYLGVYLDHKLNWKQHLEMKRTKFYAAFWVCRRAMGKTWGLKPKVALWLYKTVLLLKLTYAAVVWKSRVENVETRNLLRSLQGNYLRALVGAIRTTPTEALEVALCVPPLDRIIICMDRIPKKYQLDRKFKVQIPTRDEWKTIRLPQHPNTAIWYTDGSGANGFGAGFYCQKIDQKVTIPMGEWVTVFQAEVLAILKCVELQIAQDTKDRSILICSDSRAALGVLEKTITESSVVWDYKQALNKFSETNKITITWIPGHRGLHGNEVADGLVKLGTLEDPVEQKIGIPFAIGKESIKKSLEKEHLDSWKRGQGCRRAKLLMEKPSKSRARELLMMNKKKLRLGISLLTGHMALRVHLKGGQHPHSVSMLHTGNKKIQILGTDVLRTQGSKQNEGRKIPVTTNAFKPARIKAGVNNQLKADESTNAKDGQ